MGKTYADIAKQIRKRFEGRENDEVSQRTMRAQLTKLMEANETDRIEKEDKDNRMHESAMRFGGMITYGTGGRLIVDESIRNDVMTEARGENMGMMSYVKELDSVSELRSGGYMMANGGNIKEKYRLGSNLGTAENTGQLLNAAPNLYDLAVANNPDQTHLNRLVQEDLDLSQGRALNERQATIGRNIARENVQGANSSGQSISALASQNAAITESRIQGDLKSYITEEGTNNQQTNATLAANNAISNKEIELNEMNEANSKSVKSTALHSIAQGAQGALKDKSLTAENIRFNKQALEIVNALSPNYDWTKSGENNKYMIAAVQGIMNGGGYNIGSKKNEEGDVEAPIVAPEEGAVGGTEPPITDYIEEAPSEGAPQSEEDLRNFIRNTTTVDGTEEEIADNDPSLTVESLTDKIFATGGTEKGQVGNTALTDKEQAFYDSNKGAVTKMLDKKWISYNEDEAAYWADNNSGEFTPKEDVDSTSVEQDGPLPNYAPDNSMYNAASTETTDPPPTTDEGSEPDPLEELTDKIIAVGGRAVGATARAGLTPEELQFYTDNHSDVTGMLDSKRAAIKAASPEGVAEAAEQTKEKIKTVVSTSTSKKETIEAKAEITDLLSLHGRSTVDQIIEEDKAVSNNPLKLASKYLGIDEGNVEQQETIKGFLNNAVPGYIGKKGEVTKNTNAWCAAFVNDILTEGGHTTLDYGKDKYNLIRAKEYSNIGTDLGDITNAVAGDVVVTKNWVVNPKTKKGRWQHHVGFYSGKKGEKNLMLGGNQSNRVSVKEISESATIVAVRRIKGMDEIKALDLKGVQDTEFYDKSSSTAKTR